MKTNEKKVLTEAKMMVGRIELFGMVYKFKEEFKNDFEILKDSICQYETGNIKDINEITKKFGDLTKKYSKYIDEIIPVQNN